MRATFIHFSPHDAWLFAAASFKPYTRHCPSLMKIVWDNADAIFDTQTYQHCAKGQFFKKCKYGHALSSNYCYMDPFSKVFPPMWKASIATNHMPDHCDSIDKYFKIMAKINTEAHSCIALSGTAKCVCRNKVQCWIDQLLQCPTRVQKAAAHIYDIISLPKLEKDECASIKPQQAHAC